MTRFAIIFALNMQATIVGWKVYEITRDPLSLGLVGLAELIPAMGLALFSGHYVDRHEKRNLFLGCVLGYFLCGTAYLLITSPIANHLYNSSVLVDWLYVITFVGGIVRSFNGPASFSLMAIIIPRELYPNASTWSSSAWQTGAVLGPLTGGLLYGCFGISWALSVDLIFILIAGISLIYIKPKEIHSLNSGNSLWHSLSEGVRFVYRKKEILSSLTLDLFAVLFGGAVALLPVFASQILRVGPGGLGFLRATPSLGSFLTMILIAYFPLNKNPGKKLIGSVFGFGLCMILFGLSRNLLLSLGALFFSGIFDGVSVVIRNTILQLRTPDFMRGRVASVHSMFVGSSNEFGAFESGVTAKWMGTVPAVVFGGIMTLVVVVTTFLTSPRLKNLELY